MLALLAYQKPVICFLVPFYVVLVLLCGFFEAFLSPHMAYAKYLDKLFFVVLCFKVSKCEWSSTVTVRIVNLFEWF